MRCAPSRGISRETPERSVVDGRARGLTDLLLLADFLAKHADVGEPLIRRYARASRIRSKRNSLADPLRVDFSERVRRRVSLILALFAWLLATGSHLDVVQTVGWARMFASYAKTMSLTEAARMTFVSDNFCDVCTFVQTSKQAREGHAAPVPAGTSSTKVILAFQPSPVFVLSAPPAAPWLVEDQTADGVSRSAPPTPPPRVA
jgi:hypothetical protein